MLHAFSVDVEDYFHTEAMSQVAPRSQWKAMPSRVESATHRVLDLLDETGTKATFFILGWVAERHPALVRACAERGHEVACHSYWHRPVFRLNAVEFRQDTRQAKDAIEQACGVKVEGYRAPSFSIIPGTEWAYDVLAECGFSYDASLHPIRHGFYGNHRGPRRPHRVGEAKKLVELPMATWRLAGNNLPIAGGAYLRALPLAYVTAGLAALEREGLPAMTYVHPWEVDPEQPRLPAGWKSRLRQYVGLRGMEEKLRDLLRRFRFGRVQDAFSGALQNRAPMHTVKGPVEFVSMSANR